MMDAESIVMAVSGRRGKSCYDLLVLALNVAKESYWEKPTMKIICIEAGRRCDKKWETISRAIARANEDIWEHNREGLAEVLDWRPGERPSPKDLFDTLLYKVIQEERKQKDGGEVF